MRISIAMASYNGEKYLQEQLDSFASQKHLPDELVVCDDRSSDATVELLQKFSISAPFDVRIYENDLNLGHIKNFEKALSYCEGDLIFLSDQDDYWFPQKIKKVVEIMRANPNFWMLVHDGEITDAELTPSGLTKMKQIESAYGSARKMATGTLSAFRKELLEYALPSPDGIAGHDIWLHDVASLQPNRRTIHKENLQYIRRHGSNTSEWIVNTDKAIGRLYLLRTQTKTSSANDYTDRLKVNFALSDTTKKIRSSANSSTKHNEPRKAEYRLEMERKAILLRQSLILSGPINRRVRAVFMLVTGGYSFFSGTRSFVRDILR